MESRFHTLNVVVAMALAMPLTLTAQQGRAVL